MSKQSEAKVMQGYQAKPLSRRCKVCKNYQCDKVTLTDPWGMKDHTLEKNRRCGIRGFAVSPNAICNLFDRKEGSNED